VIRWRTGSDLPRTACREPPLREPQGSTSSPHFEVPQGRSRGREVVEPAGRTTEHPVRKPRSENKQSGLGGEHYPFIRSTVYDKGVIRSVKATDRGKRGDSPCEIIFSVTTLWTPLAAISRGKCSGVLAALWSHLSTETAHVSGG